MTGTGAAYARPSETGLAVLAGNLNLQPTASGTWTNTVLEVDLPSAGTYNLDAVVRGNLSGVTPVNTWITARLFDVTAGAVVPNTETMVYQVGVTVSAPSSITDGGNQGGVIATRYVTTGPRTIRLQAQRTNSVGASTVAAIHSDGTGRTTLRYARVA
ncbi:hypothetical protein PV410_12880 [Streptomyces sp. PA03-5A]|nr:hypothetical protein [Streptomyces sp. PA03-5A]